MKEHDKICHKVSKCLDVSMEDIKGRSQETHVIDARFISMYLIRTNLDDTFKHIGKTFNRHHSTVMNALYKVEVYSKNPSFERKLNKCL